MKKNNKFWCVFSLVVFVALTAVGCSKKEKSSTELKEFIAELKNKVMESPQKHEIHLKKLSKKLPSKIVSPFPRYVAPVSLNPKQLPLVRYPLSAIHLIGVVYHSTIPFAVVKTPEGKVYSIRVGDYIGHEMGRVTAILPQKVIVAESPDRSAKSADKTVVLRLRGSPDS